MLEIMIARKKAGLKQKEVAEELGVSPQTISNWETGVSEPSQKQLERMGKLYGQFSLSYGKENKKTI